MALDIKIIESSYKYLIDSFSKIAASFNWLVSYYGHP